MGFTTDTETQPRPVVVYRNVTCDRCDKDLPRQAGINNNDTSLQYDNNLVLKFDGGYGMFCDPEPGRWIRGDHRRHDPEHTKVLCHECAHDLAEWLDIDVHNWHTHNPNSGQHPDHHDRATQTPGNTDDS